MGKVAKTKKREVSQHSRAARRAASPIGKELASTSAAAETDHKPWLYSASSGSVTKKSKPKQLTRAQKARQQKGVERGEANEDKHVSKVLGSKQRGRRVQERRKDWEELNGELGVATAGKAGDGAKKIDKTVALKREQAPNGGEVAMGVESMDAGTHLLNGVAEGVAQGQEASVLDASIVEDVDDVL